MRSLYPKGGVLGESSAVGRELTNGVCISGSNLTSFLFLDYIFLSHPMSHDWDIKGYGICCPICWKVLFLILGMELISVLTEKPPKL